MLEEKARGQNRHTLLCSVSGGQGDISSRKELVGARIFKKQSVHCIQDAKQATHTERTSRAERRSLENSSILPEFLGPRKSKSLRSRGSTLMMANNTISQTALQTAPSRKRAGKKRRGRPLMQWDKITPWITEESSKVSKLAETYDSGRRIGYVSGIMVYPVLGARLRKASCSHASRSPPRYRCKKKTLASSYVFQGLR